VLTPQDYHDLQQYYQARGRRFSGSAERCGWLSPFTQALRFQAVTQGCDLSSAKILDVGCGYGDLLAFLQEDYTAISYTGLDIVPQFLEVSREKYPMASFVEIDFGAYQKTEKSYDYVFAVGPFNHHMADNYNSLKTALKKMFALAKTGIGVSILSDLSPEELKRAKDLFYYDPKQVLALALDISPFVELKTQYLPNDMTVMIYR
jgi:ubiquinone/menaquinone biosynthesis C-methylase UbiE